MKPNYPLKRQSRGIIVRLLGPACIFIYDNERENNQSHLRSKFDLHLMQFIYLIPFHYNFASFIHFFHSKLKNSM